MTSAVFFKALRLATKAHDGQWRKGGDDGSAPPYVMHCIEVAEAVALYGLMTDDQTAAVALLHDVLEDTEVTYAELYEQFSPYVATCVQQLTIPAHIQADTDYSALKHQYQMTSVEDMRVSALLVKYADKTCNVRDLVRYPPKWSTTAILGYAQKAQELCEKITTQMKVPTGLVQFHQEVVTQFDHVYKK